MEKEKEIKVVQVVVPPLHTYMIKEDDYASTDEVKVSLLSGQAEIAGMELKKHYPLKHTMPCIILVFSWEGAELRVEWPEEKSGRSSEEWCDLTANTHATESTMIKYLSLHYELTTARKMAHEEMRHGPRLAIVGGDNSASPLVAKLMLNYTGKLNMQPIFIDLDLDNSIFLDGCVGAAAYKYQITTNDDIFDKSEKIVYVYGNRTMREKSYMQMARNLIRLTTTRLNTELQRVRWKGCKQEVATFAAGLIVHCHRVNQDRKEHKEMLAEILNKYEITHVLIVNSPDISSFLSKRCPNIQRCNAPRLEGVDALLKLPKRKKLNQYLQEASQLITIGIDDIPIYQLTQPNLAPLSVRTIDLRTEHVNKTGVCVLRAQRQSELTPQEIGELICNTPVLYALRISRIREEEVTLEVPTVEDFWEKCRDKIWVSMIAERSAP